MSKQEAQAELYRQAMELNQASYDVLTELTRAFETTIRVMQSTSNNPEVLEVLESELAAIRVAHEISTKDGAVITELYTSGNLTKDLVDAYILSNTIVENFG